MKPIRTERSNFTGAAMTTPLKVGLDRLRELRDRATPGPWHEDGTLIGPQLHECDASANDSKDWVTFKSRRPDEDRALWIALTAAAPILITLVEIADEFATTIEYISDEFGLAGKVAVEAYRVRRAELDRL